MAAARISVEHPPPWSALLVEVAREAEAVDAFGDGWAVGVLDPWDAALWMRKPGGGGGVVTGKRRQRRRRGPGP